MIPPTNTIGFEIICYSFTFLFILLRIIEKWLLFNVYVSKSKFWSVGESWIRLYSQWYKLATVVDFAESFKKNDFGFLI